MENTNQTPSTQTTPPSAQPVTPLVPEKPLPPSTVHNHNRFYLLILIVLCLGLFIGFSIQHMMKLHVAVPKTQLSDEVALPPDAKKIEDCAQSYGTLYMRPQDIPYGATYQVWNGKVIAVGYMVPKDKFMADTNFSLPPMEHIKVDHVNVTYMSNGHMGLPIPHYYIAFYTIDKKTYDSYDLRCPNSTMDMNMQMPASNSASQTTLSPTTIPLHTASQSSMKMTPTK